MFYYSILRAHEDLERYQELIHDNEYFNDNPEMYDEYLKFHPDQTDWSVRKNKENNEFKLSTEKTYPADETKHMKPFWGKKNHKPSINVSPMTI